MTWSIDKNRPLSSAGVVELRPTDVLYHYDTPLLFRARMGFVDVLCYKLEEIGGNELLLVCPTSDERVRGLTDGKLSIRGALDSSDYWVVETKSYRTVRAWEVARADLPDDFLPERRIGLFSHFGEVPDSLQQAEAFLSFKFEGEDLVRDRISFRQFKVLVDTVHDALHKMLTPVSLAGMRTSSLLDFTIGQPQLASLLITVEEPVVDAEAVARRKRTAAGDIAMSIREDMVRERDVFMEKAAQLTGRQGGNAGLRRFIEENYEIASVLTALSPTDDSAYETVEFNAVLEGGAQRSVLIDRSVGIGLRTAYEDASYFTKSIDGRIFLVNAKAKTFVVSTAGERQVTCGIDTNRFDSLQAGGHIRIGNRVRVTGDFYPRTNRDWMTVSKIEFPN